MWRDERWSIGTEVRLQQAIGEFDGECASVDAPCVPTVYGHIAWSATLAPHIAYDIPIGSAVVTTRALVGAATGRRDHLAPLDQPTNFTTATWGGAVGVCWHWITVEATGSQLTNVYQYHPNTWALLFGVAWR